MKRLKSPTGRIINLKDAPKRSSKDGEASLVRPALLIHSGENGSEIILESADGEIAFDKKRIKNIVKCHNEWIDGLKDEYGGDEKMPIGAYPPILDQHEDESVFRICGRLASNLRYEVRDIPGVGKNCSCVLADITFLGEDVVERAEDGRLYHLSIGIDENTDTLTETSLVITPAAPGAMLLKKGNKMSKNLKRLEAHKARKKSLSAIKKGITGLTAKVSAASTAVKLAKKTGEVTHRLTGLMRSGKITPAEYKKMDVKKLAKLDQAQLDTVLETFAALEPKVLVGQRGSTAALSFSSIGKSMNKAQHKSLKAETRRDIARLMGKKLSKEEADDGEEDEGKDGKKLSFGDESTKGEGEESEKGTHSSKHLEAMKEMGKHLEAGDMDKAKECHLAAMKHCEEMGKDEEKHLELGSENQEEVSASTAELQTQIDELSTQFARIASMVEELIDSEDEEGAELSKGGEEEEEEEEESDDKGGKKLSKEEEDKKKLAADEDEKKKLKKEMGKKEEGEE